MSKSKLRHISVPILAGKFFVEVFWGNKEEGLKKIRKHFDDRPLDSFDGYLGKTYHTPGYFPAIFIAATKRNKDFCGIVAHEAVHAINYIWEDIGETSKDEAFAYAVEAVVVSVMKST